MQVAGASFASPVILTEVSGENNEVDIAYFGTTAGYFYAINSLNGNLIYSLNPTQLQLVNPVPTCPIAAGSPIGRPIALIGGTAAADEGAWTSYAHSHPPCISILPIVTFVAQAWTPCSSLLAAICTGWTSARAPRRARSPASSH